MKNVIFILIFFFSINILSQEIEVNDDASKFSLIQEFKIDKNKAFELLEIELKKLGWKIVPNKNNLLFDFPVTVPAVIRANFATNVTYMVPSNGLIELRDGRYKVSLNNIQLSMKKRHKRKVIESIKGNLIILMKTIDNILKPKNVSKEKDW